MQCKNGITWIVCQATNITHNLLNRHSLCIYIYIYIYINICYIIYRCYLKEIPDFEYYSVINDISLVVCYIKTYTNEFRN